jgi:catechol 2,3-dioxygenase-like lactoylglutathione lyase family enzyme
MPVGGESVATRFYQDVLGLPQQPKPVNLAGRGGCWFGAGAVRLHLGVEADFRPARKAHPALVVSDLTALLAAVSAAGLPVRNDEPVDGRERAFVEDPFGNRIELIQS